MLSRYTIYRRRPQGAPPLPEGIRKDTRFATRHILRPEKEMVERYLAHPNDEAWKKFRAEYLALLEQRFQADPKPFEELAKVAGENDLYLGCSCPTRQNPTVGHCHTYAALDFMQEKFPQLEVVIPQ